MYYIQWAVIYMCKTICMYLKGLVSVTKNLHRPNLSSFNFVRGMPSALRIEDFTFVGYWCKSSCLVVSKIKHIYAHSG